MERGLLSFITEHDMSEHFRVRGEDLLSCRVTTDTSLKAWRGKNTVMTKIYLSLSPSLPFLFLFFIIMFISVSYQSPFYLVQPDDKILRAPLCVDFQWQVGSVY